MQTQIQNYRNLMTLSDYYLVSGRALYFVQHLMWIEAMLDRAKVEIAELATSEAEKDISRAFTKEVYQYLDTVIRPKTSEVIKSMGPEERTTLINTLRMSHAMEEQWAKAT